MKRQIRAIYNAVAQSGISSHIYADSDWRQVFRLRDIAEQAARQQWPSARIIFENVWTCDTFKRYSVSIENEHTGEMYGGGEITAAFAGTVQEPSARYDVCATWWEA